MKLKYLSIIIFAVFLLNACMETPFQTEPYYEAWLCSVNTDGTSLQYITKHFGTIVISQDGDKIIGSCADEIYAMNPDGSERIILTDSVPDFRCPVSADTPEGNKVAFVCNSDIYTLNLITNEITNLTNTDSVFENYPSFSPDGSKITYTANVRHDYTSICMMEFNGTNNQTIYQDEYKHFPFEKPCLTASNKIVFAWGGSEDIEGGLFTVNLDGNGFQRIWDDNAYYSISNVGNFIVFCAIHGGLYRMDTDGSNVLALSEVINASETPAFSPDDSKIILRTTVYASDGSNENIVTEMPLSYYYDGYNSNKWFFLDNDTVIIKLQREYN